MSDAADVNETTDTESEWNAKECHQDGYTQIQGEMEVQLDTKAPNPTTKLFIAPLYIASSYPFYMELWPEGRDGPTNSEWQISGVFRNTDPQFVVQGSQPQRIMVAFLSSGPYKRPYETYNLEDTVEDSVDISSRPIRATGEDD